MPCNENPGENTAQERWKNKKSRIRMIATLLWVVMDSNHRS